MAWHGMGLIGSYCANPAQAGVVEVPRLAVMASKLEEELAFLHTHGAYIFEHMIAFSTRYAGGVLFIYGCKKPNR